MSSYSYLPATPGPVKGLEAVVEYQDLIMNDKRSPDQIRLTSIDGIYDSDLRDSRTPLVGYMGESAQTALAGGRTIGIEGYIQAGNLAKLREMVAGTRRAFSSLEEDVLFLRLPGTTPTNSGYPQLIIADAPQSYWRLGEQGTTTIFVDQMAAVNAFYSNGWIRGFTGALPNDPNTGLRCNDATANNALTAGNVYGFSGTASYSIEFWVEITDLMNKVGYTSETIMTKCSIGGTNGGWAIAMNGSLTDDVEPIFYRITSGGGVNMMDGKNMEGTSGWHHLVWTYNGTTSAMYWDGGAVTDFWLNDAPGSMGSTSVDLLLGDNSLQGLSTGLQFLGLDEVAIYNYALTATQVATHYAAKTMPAALTSGPLPPGWYERFEVLT